MCCELFYRDGGVLLQKVPMTFCEFLKPKSTYPRDLIWSFSCLELQGFSVGSWDLNSSNRWLFDMWMVIPILLSTIERSDSAIFTTESTFQMGARLNSRFELGSLLNGASNSPSYEHVSVHNRSWNCFSHYQDEGRSSQSDLGAFRVQFRRNFPNSSDHYVSIPSLTQCSQWHLQRIF